MKTNFIGIAQRENDPKEVERKKKVADLETLLPTLCECGAERRKQLETKIDAVKSVEVKLFKFYERKKKKKRGSPWTKIPKSLSGLKKNTK